MSTLFEQKARLEKLLVETASALDIPDYIYEDAVLKYEVVGEWL
jgi:hypothetical protein